MSEEGLRPKSVMYDDFSFDNKYGQEKFVELSACVCVCECV